MTRRGVALLTSLAAASALLLAALAFPAGAERASTATPTASTPTTAPSSTPTPYRVCDIYPRREVDPVRPARDDEITLTLGMSAICDPNNKPLNLVLVIEATDRMGDVQVEKLSAALRSAIQDLGIADRDYLRIGVVTIGEGKAQVRSFLTNDESRVMNALPDRADVGGEPCVHCGLIEALRVLWNGRAGRDVAEIREAILLATVGIDQSGCDALRSSADNLKAFGALVVTACVGRSCENRCLSDAASHARFAFRSWDWSFVANRITELVESSGPSFYPIDGVLIEDWLADGKLSYTRGGEPSEGVGNRLIWSFAPWPVEGVTRTYHARAITCGRYRASQDGPRAQVAFNGTFWSDLDTLEVAFANPLLDVPCDPPETGTPSPTSTAASATPYTPVATKEPTSDRPVSVIYLPTVLKLACTTQWESVDIALAIDVSGSMIRPSADFGGETRLAVARRIASAMLDNLEPGRDRVSIVVYGDDELLQVLSPLSDCCGTARIALERLPRYNGSRMDLAIESAQAEVTGPSARADSAKVVVVLTDGDLNLTPHDRLLRSAAEVRSTGTALHIVGIGPDAAENADVLAAVVAAPGRLHMTGELRYLAPEAILGPAPLCRR